MIELDAETWRALRRASTASLTSELLLEGLRNTFLGGVQPLRRPARMVGSALTLRYIPAREDLGMRVDYDNRRDVQRLAVERVEEDQVIVIDARGCVDSASFGHILATRIMRRGAAGLVTDGALRDAGSIARLDLPAYAAGTHATTSSVRHHPADMNVPIGCAGVAVLPGDILVGDDEGVVCIPRGLAATVARRAVARDDLEEYLWQRIDGGESIVDVYPPGNEVLDAYTARRDRDGHGGSTRG